ncbi:MAG: glutathione S-transferase family protein [Lysobacteraceae bacterium]
MDTPLTLVSHALCPYVQRVAIVLREKRIPFTRRDIDLARKPDWFLALSPTGKTPLLLVGDTPIFESAVICDYLDEVFEPRLHPAAPLARATHRAWVEFASGVLSGIAALYSAPTPEAVAERADGLRDQFARLERTVTPGGFFAGDTPSMVDAAIAPAFRYFEVIEPATGLRFFDGLPAVSAWRDRLAARPSVQAAVAPDYADRLRGFLQARDSAFGARMRAGLPTPS